jgi:hypothetical protein
MMKHVGKMKNNGAKIAVVYRTLPGDSGSCLVVGTGSLSESWHDSLMGLIQDPSGQQANELADILAVRRFPDGQGMLEGLHNRGMLKKVSTNGVIMTPTSNASVLLSELNQQLAEMKGVTVDELAVTDGVNPNPRTPAKATPVVNDDPTRTTSSSVSGEEYTAPAPAPVAQPIVEEILTPTQLRSKADKLFKEAQILRKQADAIDPPKSRKKQVVDSE